MTDEESIHGIPAILWYAMTALNCVPTRVCALSVWKRDIYTLLWYAMTALKCVPTRVCALSVWKRDIYTLLWYAMAPGCAFSLGSLGPLSHYGLQKSCGMCESCGV